MKFKTVILLFLIFAQARAGDTLLTHPKYPPIVYENGDYEFFMYTAKYFPDNMLECFKILATCGDKILERFRLRTEEEVVRRGMYEHAYRLRKEFGLDGYSNFCNFFHDRGIYYPYAMKTYILLCFHQYLNKVSIRWHYNKRLSLEGKKDENKAWKRRLDYVFEPIIQEGDADLVDPVMTAPNWYEY